MNQFENQQYRHQVKYFSQEFKYSNFLKVAPWQRSYIDKVWNLVVLKNKNVTLVDVGTGSGYIALHMAQRGLKKVIGIDLTPQAIDKLGVIKKNKKIRNMQLVLAPAEKTGLPNKYANALVANAILEHIPNESQAINEWKRLLKPKGRLLVTVPLKMNYIWPFFWPINYIHDWHIGHLRRYDLEDLRRKFNMRVVDVTYTGHMLKVLGTFLNMLIKSEKLSRWLEEIDKPFFSWVYGGSNISVIFEK